jgi:3-oxoacyl-[acyl-carrier protein] reductase/2-hydroxycyclohexanecarboxyl-CoA dehydrogenase
MKLKDKVSVVTGAGSGLGRAIALRFAQEGSRVVIAEINEATARETLKLVHAQGVEAFTVCTDVSDVGSVTNLFKSIDDRGWPVDILVNNAGNADQLVPVHLMTDEQWSNIVNVHLNGTFYCTREAIRRMLPRGSGAIVNIGSAAGQRGLQGASSYTAAKGGILAFTRGVALEYATHGIRVNCIAPGFVETPILDKLPDEVRAMAVPMTPMGRIGRPEEIAATALFLASDESSYFTGQTLNPNGGLFML